MFCIDIFMKNKEKEIDKVEFDILMKPSGTDSFPHVSTIKQFRPSLEIIEKCRILLAKKGVICNTTGFGLSCSTSRKLFESLFLTQLVPSDLKPGTPPWRCTKEPQPPKEIAQHVEQITISAPPEYFN